MLRPAIIIILLNSILATSCADLKGISTFSSSSAHTFATINNLSYGYANYAADSCYIYNKTAKDLKDFICDDSQAKVYDSLLQQEFTALANYFAALAKLAGNTELINAKPVGAAVVAGTYGKFIISSTEASIANGLTAAVTDVFTIHYKSKHITEILRKYGNDVNNYITTLALHLNNLEGEIKLMKTTLQKNAVLMMHDTGNDESKSYILFSLFKEKRESFDRVIAEYETKQATIQKILEGHRQLVQQADDLNSKSLKTKLLSLVNDISYLQ
jgi:hypothetical protein